MNFKNKLIILIVFVFSCFIIFISMYNYIFDNKIYYDLNSTYKKSILNNTKVIVVGDSRMQQINNTKNKLNIPLNFEFDSKGGAIIKWLYDIVINELNKYINDNRYNYIVVFNLGVNDLNCDIDPKILAKKYFNTYKKIINNNKDIKFYFLSVNPIVEKVINHHDPKQKRTNKKIEEFNKYFINKINDKNINNFNYCDSYNNLKFNLPDGLHYDSNTNKNIINYIINNYINFKDELSIRKINKSL